MAEKSRMQGLYDAFDRLSGREKIMVGGLAGAFFLTLITVIWLIFSSQINSLEERNQLARETLAEVMVLKDGYLAQKAELDAKKGLLDKNNLRLVQLIENEAKRVGIEIDQLKSSKRYITENHRRARPQEDPEGGPPPKIKDLTEVSETATMRRISLEQLTNFLAALERNKNPIRVTDLNISTLTSDRQILRVVKVTVSTYRNEEVKL